MVGFVLGVVVGSIAGAVASIYTEQFWGATLRQLFTDWARAAAAVPPDQWGRIGSDLALAGLWVIGVPLFLIHAGSLLFSVGDMIKISRQGDWDDEDGHRPRLLRVVVGTGSSLALSALLSSLLGWGVLGVGLAVAVLVAGGATTLIVLYLHDLPRVRAQRLKNQAIDERNRAAVRDQELAERLSEMERVAQLAADRAVAGLRPAFARLRAAPRATHIGVLSRRAAKDDADREAQSAHMERVARLAAERAVAQLRSASKPGPRRRLR